MKKIKVSLVAIFVFLFSNSVGLYAQSTSDGTIEIGIYDIEKNNFDVRLANYATLSKELSMIDITTKVFKRFIYQNEQGKEEMLLIMKQSYQTEIYNMTFENIGKILVLCVDKKLYSYALIRDGVASPLVVKKL